MNVFQNIYTDATTHLVASNNRTKVVHLLRIPLAK